jgi:hypothetical protein
MNEMNDTVNYRDTAFRKQLVTLLNQHSMEKGSNTPDFILAEYLNGCLAIFDVATARRDAWYGRPPGFEVAAPKEETDV